MNIATTRNFSSNVFFFFFFFFSLKENACNNGYFLFICLPLCWLSLVPSLRARKVGPGYCLLLTERSPDPCLCRLPFPSLNPIFSFSCFPPSPVRLVISELSMLPSICPIFPWLQCLSQLSTGPVPSAGLPPWFCVSSHAPFLHLRGVLLLTSWVWCCA